MNDQPHRPPPAMVCAMTAAVTSTTACIEILDLGGGTGLEVERILGRAPNAALTSIDLSADALTTPLKAASYHYVVSAMKLHHLPPDTKCVLYTRICSALKPGGKYVEGDYYASPRDEAANLARYHEALQQAGDDPLDNVDIPLSLDTQRDLLLRAGFARVTMAWRQNDKAVLVAMR